MRSRWRHLASIAWLLAVAILAAGCNTGNETARGADSSSKQAVPHLDLAVQPRFDLSCDGETVGQEAFDQLETVLDAVALPTSPGHAALQTSRRTTSDGAVYYFAKTGLVWDGSSAFEIAVPESFRSRVAIAWGTQVLSHRVEAACGRAGDWLLLPGGYWIAEPLCAELIVRTDTTEATVSLGLGTPCPGQAPPQGPSDG